MEPNARLCVAVAQVVKVKAGCVASHEDEEVRMGRTKDELPPRSKSEREFDHEVGNIVFVLNAIDAGRLDHLFVDAETKAAVRADWMAKGEAVVRSRGGLVKGAPEVSAGRSVRNFCRARVFPSRSPQ